MQRPEYPNASAELWKSVSLDARRLGNVTPKALASEELWPGGAPQWARDAWLEMQAVLGNSRGKSLLGGFLPRSDKPARFLCSIGLGLTNRIGIRGSIGINGTSLEVKTRKKSNLSSR